MGLSLAQEDKFIAIYVTLTLLVSARLTEAYLFLKIVNIDIF